MKLTLLFILFSFGAMSQSQYRQDPFNRYDPRRDPTRNDDMNRFQRGSSPQDIADNGFAEASLEAAIRVLQTTRVDQEDQARVDRMLEKAYKAKLKSSPNSSSCRRGAAAWVAGGTTINICEGFYLTQRIDYGQYLILHELAHLAGIHNECQTDVMARKVLYGARENIVPSGYDDRCQQESQAPRRNLFNFI